MVTKNIHTYYKTTTTTKLMFSKLYIFNSLIFFSSCKVHLDVTLEN